jgi:hypothetical protein
MEFIKNKTFNELTEFESENINGGAIVVPVLVAIGVGVASYFAYEFANEGVKRSTGKSIPQNASYYAGKAMSTVGNGLQTVGDYLSK